MIEARGLVKRYGATAAVDDLSFTIRPSQPDPAAASCSWPVLHRIWPFLATIMMTARNRQQRNRDL